MMALEREPEATQTQLWVIKQSHLFSWPAEGEQQDIAKRSEIFTCQRLSVSP